MTPSIPDSQLEQFIQQSCWSFGDEPRRLSYTQGSRSEKNNVLVLAGFNTIYVMDNDNEIIKLGRRENIIFSICSHHGRLYEAGKNKKITEMMSGEDIAQRAWVINQICSYAGRMYDATADGYVQITETCSVAMQSDCIITGMCPHEGDLYAFSVGKLFRTSGHIPFFIPAEDQYFKDLEDIDSLCSHEGSLFAAAGNKVYEQSNLIASDEFKDEKVWSLCSHEGHLYASGSMKGIFDLSAGLWYAEDIKRIETMCSHPRQYFVEWGVLPP